MKKLIKTGNLFDFAEARLLERLKKGEINSYSIGDIIEGAIKVRKYLDKHEGKTEVPEPTIKEKKIKNNQYRRSYWLRYHK